MILRHMFIALTEEAPMPTVPVDQATLDALVAKVSQLQADKKGADDATAASSAAHTALTKASADAAASDSIEAQADAKVTADLVDLKSFVDGLGSAPTPPPA